MFLRGALLIVLLVAPTRADELQDARDHYHRATKAYEVAQYDEAIQEFAAAYKLKDDPSILFNLAQSHRLAGHHAQALATYRMFLAKMPDSPNRREVEALIAGLQQSRPSNVEDPDSELARRYYSSGAAKYEAHQYEAAIIEFEKARLVKPVAALDFNIGRAHDRLGHTEEALVAYRRYVVGNPEPGDAAEVRARIVTLEQRLAVEKPVKPAEPARVPAPEPTPKVVDAHAGRTKTIAGIAVAVVGVAALAGGIACGVLSQQNSDDLSKLDQTMGTFSSSKESAGKSEQIAEGVLLGVGGAAVVTGVVLVVLGRRAAHRSVAVLPAIGRNMAGATIGWTF